MSTIYLSITAHDPIIARDGRPFGIGQGIRMRSLDWPYPSVLAGSLRTMLGKLNGGFFQKDIDNLLKDLLDIRIAGPLPLKDTQIYLPMPKDILAKKDGKEFEAIPLRPEKLGNGEVCDFPNSRLLPAMISETNDDGNNDDFKPEELPAFWSFKKMTEWLVNPSGLNFNLCKDSEKKDDDLDSECNEKMNKKVGDNDPDFLASPKRDERVHTGIDPKTGTAAIEEGLLFMSVGLDMSTTEKGGGIRLAARVEAGNPFEEIIGKLNEIHPFGGERRLAHWSKADEPVGWRCPPEISSKLKKLDSGRIRMVLATPAIFSKGWMPGWLDSETLEGIPPRLKDDPKFKLKLISACTDRWRPISGWSAEAKSRGPKAIRRMVPAGSVYFFEAKSAEAASDLAKSYWLESVCDEKQDCKDGFGLAVWGVWEEAKKADKTDGNMDRR
jgi:CRISPR-associated protein Cmr3